MGSACLKFHTIRSKIKLLKQEDIRFSSLWRFASICIDQQYSSNFHLFEKKDRPKFHLQKWRVLRSFFAWFWLVPSFHSSLVLVLRCGCYRWDFPNRRLCVSSHNPLDTAGDFIVDEGDRGDCRPRELMYVSFTSVFIFLSQQESIRI